jgi:4-hydroxythreonine-4-phosphate dehydrogenase
MGNQGTKPRIAITIGDVAGIGPEVTLKAISLSYQELPSPPIIIGDYHFISEECSRFSLDLPLIKVEKEGSLSDAEGLLLLDIPNLPRKINRGTLSREYGRCAWDYLEKAISLSKEKKVTGIVTAPVNKASLHAASFPFSGQTEFFASAFGVSDYAMMLASGGYRVAFLTTHVSLAEAIAHIRKDKIISLVKLVDQELGVWLGMSKPRIGIAALNPHAGEEGVFGEEEIREIRPAVEELKEQGVEISGPFPADTLFHPESSLRFDALIALYHDQGMIPIKSLFFNRAVNITLGLPIIRTSPVHGTAFDIVGKGIADPNSMIEAIRLAYFLSMKGVR